MISKEQVKHIRSLQQKKFRNLHRQFIIEGEKLIEEAILHAPNSVLAVYGIMEQPIFIPPTIPYHQIDSKALQQISALKTPQGIVAVCSFLETSISEASGFYLAIDTLQDPGNFGTILRLAAWFGIQNVICSIGTVDCYNPKVVQASMGAIFHVHIEYVNLELFIKEENLPVYGAVLDGNDIYRCTLDKKGILLIGNEGNGIQEELQALITHPVTIPKVGKGESLNAAMATAVLLSEFARR